MHALLARYIMVAPIRALQLVAVVLLSICLAQGTAKAQEPKIGPDEETAGKDLEYVIGLGDVIEVHIWKEPDLSRILPVRMDGRISLPLLGDVVAAGKTPRELAGHIQKRLGDFMEEPAVAVMLAENHSRKYFVVGQVNEAGEFPIDFPISVLQAIARSGGFQEWAKTSEVVVIRRESGRERRFEFDYDAVVKGRDLQQNVLVAPGDTIIVP